MFSFVLRRTRLRLPGTFRVVQRFPTNVVLSNQRLALTSQRNFTTTTNNRNKESTPNVEPEPEPEPKPKSKPRSMRPKKGSSAKVAGKVKNVKRSVKSVKKSVKKRTKKEQKVIIKPQNRPPKQPGNAFCIWFSEWCRSQPKTEPKTESLSNAQVLSSAQSRMKEASQVWNALSDHEKQQYREKGNSLWAEYKKRREEWYGQVDPAILKELNRRRVAKGLPRIWVPPTDRPLSGYLRYFLDVRREYPGTEADARTRFKAISRWVASQWNAMSDTEKAKYTNPAEADVAAWREKRRAESPAKLNG